jgi:hypothetical protein
MGKPMWYLGKERDRNIYPISRGYTLPPVSRAANSALKEESLGWDMYRSSSSRASNRYVQVAIDLNKAVLTSFNRYSNLSNNEINNIEMPLLGFICGNTVFCASFPRIVASTSKRISEIVLTRTQKKKNGFQDIWVSSIQYMSRLKIFHFNSLMHHW